MKINKENKIPKPSKRSMLDQKLLLLTNMENRPGNISSRMTPKQSKLNWKNSSIREDPKGCRDIKGCSAIVLSSIENTREIDKIQYSQPQI